MNGTGVTGFQPPAAQIVAPLLGGPGARRRERHGDDRARRRRRGLHPVAAVRRPDRLRQAVGEGRPRRPRRRRARPTSAPARAIPTKMLDYLRGLTSDVTPGRVPTTCAASRRRTTTPRRACRRRCAQPARVAAAELRGRSSRLRLASIPIDIWVDGDGRIVRMVTATSLDVNGQSVQSDVQVDYFDFGVPVDVHGAAGRPGRRPRRPRQHARRELAVASARRGTGRDRPDRARRHADVAPGRIQHRRADVGPARLAPLVPLHGVPARPRVAGRRASARRRPSTRCPSRRPSRS